MSRSAKRDHCASLPGFSIDLRYKMADSARKRFRWNSRENRFK